MRGQLGAVRAEYPLFSIRGVRVVRVHGILIKLVLEGAGLLIRRVLVMGDDVSLVAFRRAFGRLDDFAHGDLRGVALSGDDDVYGNLHRCAVGVLHGDGEGVRSRMRPIKPLHLIAGVVQRVGIGAVLVDDEGAVFALYHGLVAHGEAQAALVVLHEVIEVARLGKAASGGGVVRGGVFRDLDFEGVLLQRGRMVHALEVDGHLGGIARLAMRINGHDVEFDLLVLPDHNMTELRVHRKGVFARNAVQRHRTLALNGQGVDDVSVHRFRVDVRGVVLVRELVGHGFRIAVDGLVVFIKLNIAFVVPHQRPVDVRSLHRTRDGHIRPSSILMFGQGARELAPCDVDGRGVVGAVNGDDQLFAGVLAVEHDLEGFRNRLAVREVLHGIALAVFAVVEGILVLPGHRIDDQIAILAVSGHIALHLLALSLPFDAEDAVRGVPLM